MSDNRFLKLQVSLKGRNMRTYSFTSEEITIGRDPDSDVVLDNPGISRNHVVFHWTPAGYMIKDLGSANGTYLNDEAISQEVVGEGDVIHIGKFVLEVSLTDERNLDDEDDAAIPAEMIEGTTVLSRDQLKKVMASSKEAEAAPDLRVVAGGRPDSAGGFSRHVLLLAAAGAFLIGVAVGAALGWGAGCS